MQSIVIYCIFCVALFFGIYGKSVYNDSENEYESNHLKINFTPLVFDKENDRLYYIGTVYKGNFYQALQFCNYFDMALLSIETMEENNFLFNSLLVFIGAGSYGFWTAGTLLPENHWIWISTGRPVTQDHWVAPPFVRSKGCIEVKYVKSSKILIWGADDCNADKHVICEAPKT